MTGRFEWMDYALCAEVGGGIFFPDHGDAEMAAEAKRVCGLCVVKAPCLVFLAGFSDLNDRYGIAGGLPEKGRRQVRRQLRSERTGQAA